MHEEDVVDNEQSEPDQSPIRSRKECGAPSPRPVSFALGTLLALAMLSGLALPIAAVIAAAGSVVLQRGPILSLSLVAVPIACLLWRECVAMAEEGTSNLGARRKSRRVRALDVQSVHEICLRSSENTFATASPTPVMRERA